MDDIYNSDSYQAEEYTQFEPTQLSQPRFNETQNSQWANSQVEPRRKYWGILIPTNSDHSILKLPWGKPVLRMGRADKKGMNDVVYQERRVSNLHCRITLGLSGGSSEEESQKVAEAKNGEAEPSVWVEDLKSSNGTFVNGDRITTRRLLCHGDELSLGHAGTLKGNNDVLSHDVRYIFRSVGKKGTKLGQPPSQGGMELVGEVYERYQFLNVGSFAEVRRAVDLETGDERAIKQIVKHRFANNAKTLNLFKREIEISSRLEHENICRLVDWFEDPQHICLVLEYIDGGDLLDFVMKYPSGENEGIPEEMAARFTLQICRAMAYTNILLTKETPGCPATIKVADFGLAKMVDNATMLKSMVGTPQYLAPEVVMQTAAKPGYDELVDSWSVGIIVYSMMTKALPFDEDADLPIDKRIRAKFTIPWDESRLEILGISDLAKDFIGQLLIADPAERMTLTEALTHEWLAGPSSQPSESQQMGLGGDSAFSIVESFDSFSTGVNTINGLNGWSRPQTASGSNFLGTDSVDQVGEEVGHGIQGSSEEFSQPMGNLNLGRGTGVSEGMTGMATGMNGMGMQSRNGQGEEEDGDDETGNENLFDQPVHSIPSPPLTASDHDDNENENINEDNNAGTIRPRPALTIGKARSIVPDTPAESQHDISMSSNTDTNPQSESIKRSATRIPTPDTSGTSSPYNSLKRKQPARNGKSAMEVDSPLSKEREDRFFSSGSLSPPPVDDTKGKGKDSGVAEGKTPVKKLVNGEEPRRSPRRSTRKSMRLV